MGELIQSKSRKIIYISLIALAISVVAEIILIKPAGAIMESTWPWANYEPSVAYSNPIPDAMAMTICPSKLLSESVFGEPTDMNVCITQGSSLKFGMYRKGNDYMPVVAFANSGKMYRLLGAPCSVYDPCTYIPGADVLVTKRRVSAPLGESIILFNDFSKRIHRTIDPDSLAMSFNFDASNPDYIYTSDPASSLPVGGYGASENGDWLTLEIREKGIYVLNLHTRELRRISTMALNYFGGMAPSTEMTISNDGRHVAIMGMNAYITIFDIYDNCGDVATDRGGLATSQLKAPCKTASINTDKFIPHFFASVHPRFSSDGGELSFYAMGYRGDQREVVLAAAGYMPIQLSFLGLGDSYSSGEGETSDAYYQKGTNETYEKCHLSTRSYPYLTAKLLGLSDGYVKSVACSGATTNDVIGWTPNYQGQGDRLKTAPISPQQKEFYQTEAREGFMPGRILQSVFIEQYQPKIVTIGIGGNDVGFMEKLKACLGVDSCEWASTPEGREKTAVEIQGLFWTLLDTYTNLRRLSPQSTIYAIGYPKIIDPNGNCGAPLGLMFDSTERQFMDEGIKYLNQVVAAAARKAGVHYIDVENSLGQQVLCGDDKASAMNWIRLGDDSGVSNNFNNVKVIGYESFHPNPIGQALISKVVAGAISNGTAAYACATSDIACYNSVQIPWPPGYWLLGGVMHDYVLQHNVKFSSDQIGSINGKQKTINMPLGLFDVNAKVHVELHSDPVSLGDLTTDDQGGLSASITLPSDTPDGYHTLHLYGTSYSGERVDYYDVINTTPVPNSKSSTTPSKKINTGNVGDSAVSMGEASKIVNDFSMSRAQSNSSINPQGKKEVLGDSINTRSSTKMVDSLHIINWFYVTIGTACVSTLMLAIGKSIVGNRRRKQIS